MPRTPVRTWRFVFDSPGKQALKPEDQKIKDGDLTEMIESTAGASNSPSTSKLPSAESAANSLTNLKATIEKLKLNYKGRDLKKLLGDRKWKELEFHNQNRDKNLTASLPNDTYELLHGNKKYYQTTALSQDYITSWFQTHLPGKVVLDYACGNGPLAIRSAKLGAEFSVGIDISDVSVQNASQEASSLGLSDRVSFMQADCENTGLPDNSFDVIICSGMLHHLDLSYAFPELRRVLKPGGVILAIEALDYNPLIKLYRNLTPSMRTEWEKAHILSLKDVEFASRFFEVGSIRYFHILAPLAVFASRIPGLSRPVLALFNWVDSWLTRTPLVRLMSWQFIFELRKVPA